jgi:hypothetical protein
MRKYYLRHVMRLVPHFTPRPLINGSAFHLGKATFYQTRKEKPAQEAMLAYLRECREEFEYKEDYITCKTRLPFMLTAWIAKFGLADLKNFKFLEIEKEHRMILNGGFLATSRPDAVVENRDGELLIMETKTTTYSAEMTEVSVNFGDQATTYLASVAKAYPKRHIAGLIPDIVFWLKNSKTKDNIHCIRGSLVQREKYELQEWQLEVETLLSEISQKVAALKTYPPIALFPRNTEFCVSYNSPCPYLHICRERLDLSKAPHGFKKEENDEEAAALLNPKPLPSGKSKRKS